MKRPQIQSHATEPDSLDIQAVTDLEEFEPQDQQKAQQHSQQKRAKPLKKLKQPACDPAGYVQGPLKWAIALTASLGAILEVIDTSIVNVALTDMQATLGATVTEIAWVVTGYAIANVVMIPLSAWLGDFFGKKTYFVFSMIGFTAASVLSKIWV